MANYMPTTETKSYMDLALALQRTGAFPLDKSTMFDSYADAVKYAAGDKTDPDKRGLCGTSYVGQAITVYENGVVTMYSIQEDRSLKEVGSATSGDNASIILTEDGVLKLKGFDTAKAGQHVRVKNVGTEEEPKLELEFFTPDTSSAAQVAEDVANIKTILNGTEEEPSKGLIPRTAEVEKKLEDVYTKTEVDNKLASVYEFKGSFNSFADLLAAVEDGTIVPKSGWTYNIDTAGGKDMNNIDIKAGDNVAYVDDGEKTGWDCLSGIVDLTNYYAKGEVDSAINTAIKNKDDADKIALKEITDSIDTVKSDLTTTTETVDTMKATVGDENAGLVKDVADNKATITKLTGEETEEGSVKQIVAASVEDIKKAVDGLTGEDGTINAAVKEHNEATDAHADLFAAKQNKAIKVDFTAEAASFVEAAEGVAKYKADITVPGLEAEKNYGSQITPDLASCAVVNTCHFYPTVEMNGNVLTIFCDIAPTVDVSLHGVFTEIQ